MITESDFKKFTKNIFTNNDPGKKRHMIIGTAFIQSWYDEHGRQGLIDLLNSCNIMVGQDACDLIDKLLKETDGNKS